MKLDHLFSIRFTTHDYGRLKRVAEQDDSTIARLIRKWVLAGLSAAEADWYADPNNRATIGQGIRRQEHFTIGTGNVAENRLGG